MQYSGKQHRPEAPFKDLNLVPFSSWKLWQFTTSEFHFIHLSWGQWDSSIEMFQFLPILLPLMQKTTAHFAPTQLYHLFSAFALLLPPTKLTSIDCIYHLALLLFCFHLGSANGSHWQEIRGKEEEEIGLFPYAHTAPFLSYCCSRGAAFLSDHSFNYHLAPVTPLSLLYFKPKAWFPIHWWPTIFGFLTQSMSL